MANPDRRVDATPMLRHCAVITIDIEAMKD
jgi:hypothetical protein